MTEIHEVTPQAVLDKFRERKRANEILRKECEKRNSVEGTENQKWKSFQLSTREMVEFFEGGSMKTGQEKVHKLRQDLAGKWPHPTTLDSWVFLVTEVGEVGDALIRQGYGERSAYVRNSEKRTDLHKELGDVYLMLCTLATHLGVDLDEALDEVIGRLREKHKLSPEEVDAVIERIKRDGAIEFK